MGDVTLTMRVRNGPAVVSTHPNFAEAARTLRACTDLAGDRITGWSIE